MTHDWILDVLADLKAFASANDLRALAEQLDDAKLIAAAEIASLGERAQAQAYDDTCSAGSDIGGIGRHQRA
jgi:hypothetical protein